MLSCLPGLTSGSTTNGIPGSGSTDSVGSTGSFSDGSVTIMHEWDVRISMMPWLCKKCYAWNEMHALVWYPRLCKGDKTCIMNGTYAMMHKRNTRDDNDPYWTCDRRTSARIKKRTITTNINHKLNRARRGHYKELMKIGFAAKVFSYN